MKSKIFLNSVTKTLFLSSCLYITTNMAVAAQTIDILMYSHHSSEEEGAQGAIEGLKQNGYGTDKGTIINIKNADADINELNSIVKSSVARKPNIIFATSTSIAQAVAKATKDIPVVFVGLTDPVMSKVVTNLEAPEANITGVIDFVPVESQLKFIQEIVPNVKKIGVVYTPSAGASAAAQLKLIKSAKAMGIEIIGGASSSLLDIETTTGYMIDKKVDAIYIPSDDKIVVYIDKIVEIAQAHKIPVFAADSESVKKGVIAAISFNYIEIGTAAGKMAAKILRGEKISSIPVSTPDKVQSIVNMKAAEQFKVRIPDSILKIATEIIK